MQFTGKLPEGFVRFKPLQPDNSKYKMEDILRAEREGRLLISRKRDGWGVMVAIDADRNVRFYTEGNNLIEGKLVHLADEIRRLRIPPLSLFATECHLEIDNRGAIGGYLNPRVSAADALRKLQGLPKLSPFAIFYLDGKEYRKPFGQAMKELRTLMDGTELVAPVDLLDMSLKAAQTLVRKEGWEGLVLYDRDFIPPFRLDGKSTPRAVGSWKWKPIDEDDFIVRSFRPREDGTVKDLVLTQIDPKTRKEFACGKYGTLSKEDRVRFAKRKYPFVAQVTFNARFPKSGKLDIMAGFEVRTDKKVKDCICPQSYPEPDYV